MAKSPLIFVLAQLLLLWGQSPCSFLSWVVKFSLGGFNYSLAFSFVPRYYPPSHGIYLLRRLLEASHGAADLRHRSGGNFKAHGVPG